MSDYQVSMSIANLSEWEKHIASIMIKYNLVQGNTIPESILVEIYTFDFKYMYS